MTEAHRAGRFISLLPAHERRLAAFAMTFAAGGGPQNESRPADLPAIPVFRYFGEESHSASSGDGWLGSSFRYCGNKCRHEITGLPTSQTVHGFELSKRSIHVIQQSTAVAAEVGVNFNFRKMAHHSLSSLRIGKCAASVLNCYSNCWRLIFKFKSVTSMDKFKSAMSVFLRTVLPTLLGLVVLIGVIAWLSGAFTDKIEPGRTESSPPTLGTEPTDVVREVTKDYIEEAVGTLKAASRTEVSAKVLATIKEVTVSGGDLVDAGDVLIRLDHEEMQSREDQAEQALLMATANRKNAETAFARAQQLKERNVSSQSDYDAAVAQKDVAVAQEAQAQQAIEEAKIILSYAEITAPKAGRVVDRLAEPGDTARPGEPLLVIYDAESLRLEAPVLEKLAVQLKIGDKLMVHVDALDREVEAASIRLFLRQTLPVVRFWSKPRCLARITCTKECLDAC